MKALFLILPLLSIFSCTTNKPEVQQDLILQELMQADQAGTAPAPAPAPSPTPPQPPAPVGIVEEAPFDPGSISRGEYIATKTEMQILIEEINRVIRSKDYAGWVSYLSDEFIQTINSSAFLDEISQSSRLLRSKEIQLKSARDYFTYVVVAARENVRIDSRLDDIEFLSHNRVKAYSLFRNQRVRLFEFVRAGDTWKIAPPPM